MLNIVSKDQTNLYMHDKKCCGCHEQQVQSAWDNKGRQVSELL